MESSIFIINRAGTAIAEVANGRLNMFEGRITKDEVPSVMLATIGWSGMLKLARQCRDDLLLQVLTYLDLERAKDFVDAYVAARTRHPTLSQDAARMLVMTYWLLEQRGCTKPDSATEDRLKAWLKPRLFGKRPRLSRSDLVALAYMGVSHESTNPHGPNVSLFPTKS